MTHMVAGLNQLYKVKRDVDDLQRAYPDLGEQLVHVVSLTRQLQLKYGYMASLIKNEELPKYAPKFLRTSVLSLYQEEVQKLKEHPDIDELKQLLKKYENISDSTVFLMILGAKPELLQGSVIMN
ncbi:MULTISPECIES: hypothetical protein [Salimicrobium]|uniref:Uncharacterized protein n=1 Tax=Salimicrobium humidisoli TaxID=2029857 RepID=A0ABX4HTQ2_9BACI|nr:MULTISPECIES: hypothetical protein [Salimicrobium]PBB06604.1 hypothetical protein CKW00_02840 [Salimicrobium humidisoli]